MVTLKKNILGALGSAVFLCVFLGAHAQAAPTSAVRFGSSLTLLVPSGHTSENLLYPLELSPTGEYVAGTLDVNNNIGDAIEVPILYLWDTQIQANQVGIEQRLPIATLTLSKPTTYVHAALAFSSVSQEIAVWDRAALRILALPDLQEQRAIEVVWPYLSHTLVWSKDGTRLVGLGGDLRLENEKQTLIVWNLTTGDVRTYSLEASYYKIVDWEEEWLFTTASGEQHPNLFAVCNSALTQCTPYAYPGRVYAIARSEQIIITTRIDNRGRQITGLWTRRDDGAFLLDERILSELDSLHQYSKTLSPEGKFLVSNNAVWRLSPPEVVQQLEGAQWSPTWLDEEHFVTRAYDEEGNLVIYLYRVGEENPLDVLTVEKSAVDDFIAGESLRLTSSADGRWLLFNLGHGALLIPVVHE